MKRLCDVVNFNADASCLDAKKWFSSLQGGKQSDFYRWLELYVINDRKVVLGLTGATVVDVVKNNPEAISLINEKPDIFEMILRPFAHDIAILRTNEGFKFNFDLGEKVICREFKNINRFYLPPEFMLTNEQLALLEAKNVDGVFINASRYSRQTAERLPNKPYIVHGIRQKVLNCIPFNGSLTSSYLKSIQTIDPGIWVSAISRLANDLCFSWRDGESAFLLPDGLLREANWLEGEKESLVERVFLSEILPELNFADHRDESAVICNYPLHSFTSWVQEFRVMGFLECVRTVEQSIAEFSSKELVAWLMSIGSDILSAIEKDSPVILLNDYYTRKEHSYTIWRSTRGVEGEEYLAMLKDGNFPASSDANTSPAYISKYIDRFAYLNEILKNRSCEK